jgi:hypothetical protein
MRLSVLVTHSQNCDQELERPLRRAVVMNQLTLASRRERVPQKWQGHATELSQRFLEAKIKFAMNYTTS